ncbi:hypothetical protein DLAC_03539 [Tieghemostelium lacteum]|uniref:MACPF domain-containing protein n=1 Tax=Tieghemostelium lacteum TaxID=361077 RepID=A0A152A1U2_TIELA|nr:hypothetical protein DLAC_03539 [Tieghemostelium lacteum]|eukprot:KYR00041.1 hypothetical protein DLAC_03539 [Tieghemostelium lacteum]
MKIYGIILFLLFITNNIISIEIEIDNQSSCNVDCVDKPFSNFKTAIQYLHNINDSTTPTIKVHYGIYSGPLNNDLDIHINLNIIGLKSNYGSIIIDGSLVGNCFNIRDSTVSIENIYLTRCVSKFGGGIYAENSSLLLDKVVFVKNAANSGGAIYMKSSTATISTSKFISNKANSNQGGIMFIVESTLTLLSNRYSCNQRYDFYATGNQSFVFISPLDNEGIDSTSIVCIDDAQIRVGNNLICGTDLNSNCNDDSGLPSDPVPPIDNYQLERIGWKFQTYRHCVIPAIRNNHYSTDASSCTVAPLTITTYLEYPEIEQFMPSEGCFASGLLLSNVIVPDSDEYYFQLESENIGILVLVDNKVIFNSYFISGSDRISNSERKMMLGQDQPHLIKLIFFSINEKFSERKLSLRWKRTLSDSYQPIPSTFISSTTSTTNSPVCGDGFCNEDPVTCLIDCWQDITPLCKGLAPPSPITSSYPQAEGDFIGSLVNNQYLYSIPGINHMSHGVDITTFEDQAHQIFYHGYCDNSTFSTVQSTYRKSVYTIPSSIHAQISPKCSYDIQSQSYSNSEAYSIRAGIEAGLDGSFSLSGGLFGFEAAMSASMSFSGQYAIANNLERKTSSSIHVSEFNCETTKMHLNKANWHPSFIKDLSLLHTSNSTELQTKMVSLIKRYGTLYKKSAVFGGKLLEMSTIYSEFLDSTSDQDLSWAIGGSFSASISRWGAKGSGKISGSYSSDKSESFGKRFHYQSYRSDTIVMGGSSGSYGSDLQDPLMNWVSTIDLNPVVIRKSLGLISDLIPEDWYLDSTKSNTNIKELWKNAENLLYKSLFRHRITTPKLLTDRLNQSNPAGTLYLFTYDGPMGYQSLTLNIYSKTMNIFPNNYISTDGPLFKETDPTSSLSLQFGPTIPNYRSVLVQRLPFIYDVFTSRQFRLLAPSEIAMQYNQIRIRLPNYQLFKKQSYLVGDETSNQYQLTILTDSGKIQVPTVNHLDLYVGKEVAVSTGNNYLGNIYGILIKLKIQPLNIICNISTQIDAIIISQVCPDTPGKVKSNCVHKSYSTTLVREHYERAFITDNLTPILIEPAKPFYFRVVPIGKSSSLYFNTTNNQLLYI